MSSYQITVHDKFHSHASRGVGEKTAYARSTAKTPAEREFGSWLLWPNFCLEVYPGGYLNVFHHLPQEPEKTLQLIEWYFPQQVPTAEQQQVIDFVDSVRNEDIPLCETVQKGFHSRGYTQGRLIANESRGYFSEHAVHDFQKKVVTSLGKFPD
jgi:choline monooxygenase